MAKRNARKQATRAELEAEDPVCRKLVAMLDDADLLILTQGADYDTDAVARDYDTRLAYLPVILSELIDFRVTLLVAESTKPEPKEDEDDAGHEETPVTQEGATDAADDAETE